MAVHPEYQPTNLPKASFTLLGINGFLPLKKTQVDPECHPYSSHKHSLPKEAKLWDLAGKMVFQRHESCRLHPYIQLKKIPIAHLALCTTLLNFMFLNSSPSSVIALIFSLIYFPLGKNCSHEGDVQDLILPDLYCK